MQPIHRVTPSAARYARYLLRAATLIGLFLFALAIPTVVSADPGDVGFQGPSGTGAGASPTGSKPESKLWFNDGSWWASFWDTGTSDYYIWKLDRTTETWSRTGTRLDDRNSTRADILWDGSKLYVASHNFSESDGSGESRLYRYSYNASTDVYTLDAGFPATINTVRSETLVIAKDSTGKLWATWEQGGRIWVNRTTSGDATWGTPFMMPAASPVDGDDVSTILAFGSKIGVFWSNQSLEEDFFAIHDDAAADLTWATPEVAYSGNNVADDHMNLKTDSSGRVFCVVKTSLTGTNPLVVFLVRTTGGSWSSHTVGLGTQDPTRPIMVVDEANDLFRVYMTEPTGGGAIYEKTSSRGAISFPGGLGTLVMSDANLTLSAFQKHIFDRYEKPDRARGTPGTWLHFSEEVGELARALARNDDRANLEEEFADVLAWLCTLANINDVDLTSAVTKKYLSAKAPKGHK